MVLLDVSFIFYLLVIMTVALWLSYLSYFIRTTMYKPHLWLIKLKKKMLEPQKSFSPIIFKFLGVMEWCAVTFVVNFSGHWRLNGTHPMTHRKYCSFNTREAPKDRVMLVRWRNVWDRLWSYGNEVEKCSHVSALKMNWMVS